MNARKTRLSLSFFIFCVRSFLFLRSCVVDGPPSFFEGAKSFSLSLSLSVLASLRFEFQNERRRRRQSVRQDVRIPLTILHRCGHGTREECVPSKNIVKNNVCSTLTCMHIGNLTAVCVVFPALTYPFNMQCR